MKFLADENIEKSIVDELREMGYDIKWVADAGLRMDDMAVFNAAGREKRILLTNDKDFGEIVFRQRFVSSGIVLLRIKGQDAGEKVRQLKKLLAMHDDMIDGHFVVVSKDRFRFIPL